MFGDGSLLLCVQCVHECDKLLKELLNVGGGVVFGYHLLEFLLIIHSSSVEANQFGELPVYCPFEFFDFNLFVSAPELFPELVEVNLTQINNLIGFIIRGVLYYVTRRRDGLVKQVFDSCYHIGDVSGCGQAVDFAGDDINQCTDGNEVMGG